MHRRTVRASASIGSSTCWKMRARSISDWPPYDIVKTGNDAYRISIAVAGFAQDDLDITFQSNLLKVTGKKQEASADRSAPSSLPGTGSIRSARIRRGAQVGFGIGLRPANAVSMPLVATESSSASHSTKSRSNYASYISALLRV